jgi:nucleoside 2-deoxyribosyltransferase
MSSKITQLRCFVAMAFGRLDADAVYDAIKKALRPMHIKLVRADRIEHNDDIDDRIIAEIERADFVLADLTYARPSVYFEAGYAQRSVPVIYTARRDHFKDKPDDTNGNLRVHFDLQMRNIITWSGGDDPNFLKRLKSRITKVIAPIIARKKAESEQKRKTVNFDRLSIQDKQKFVIRAAGKHFRRCGYQLIRLRSEENSSKPPLSRTPAPFRGGISALKQSPAELHFVVVHTTPSITKELCALYRMLIAYPLYHGETLSDPEKAPKRIREDFVICSFGSGGLTRLHKGISYLRAAQSDHTLFSDRPLAVHRYRAEFEIPRQTVFHVFESTPRLLALPETLSERFT